MRPLGPVGRALALVAVLAIGYPSLAFLTFQLSAVGTPAFFPAAGLTLAVFLLGPTRLWPVFVAVIVSCEVALDTRAGLPLDTAVALGVANAAEALTGAALIRRFSGGRVRLQSIRDFALWGIASAVSTAVSASIATPALVPGGSVDVWLGWWSGDLVGQLVVTPFICSFTSITPPVPDRPRRAVEAAATVVASFALAGAVWLLEPALVNFVFATTIAWVALRFTVRGVARFGILVAPAVTAEALWHPAASNDRGVEAHTYAQFFLIVTLTGALLLAAETYKRICAETALREREALLDHEASHDSLTGLANRALLMRHLDGRVAARGTGAVALLYCDLDGFKAVNDTLGHHAGDELLREVARRLLTCAPPGALVARLGGDEFVVVLDDADAPAARSVAGSIAAALAVPVELGRTRLQPVASIGVAAVRGDDVTAEDVLREADHAMYQAKQAGRRMEPGPHIAVRTGSADRRVREDALRGVLERDELDLHYQPIVRLRDGAVAGVEALVRWRHEGRVLHPSQFLEAAAALDLLVPIETWLTERSVAQLAAWDSELGTNAPGWVAVNLSSRRVMVQGWVEHLAETLHGHDIDARRLVVEVEGSVIASAQADGLDRLAGLGARLAVNDFGVGGDGLAALRIPAVGQLKIDRTLAATVGEGAHRESVLAGVLAMARTVGVEAVAAGVESESQYRALVDLDCAARESVGYAQGFYVCPPLPAPALTDRLRAWPAELRV